MAMYTLRFPFTLHIGVGKESQYRLAAPLIGNMNSALKRMVVLNRLAFAETGCETC